MKKYIKTLGILAVVSLVFAVFGGILDSIKINDESVPSWPFLFFVAYFGTVKLMNSADLHPAIVAALSGFTAAFSGAIVNTLTDNETAAIITMVVLMVTYLVMFMGGGVKWFKDPVGVLLLIIVMLILPGDEDVIDMTGTEYVTILIALIVGWLLCLGLTKLGAYFIKRAVAKATAKAAAAEGKAAAN